MEQVLEHGVVVGVGAELRDDLVVGGHLKGVIHEVVHERRVGEEVTHYQLCRVLLRHCSVPVVGHVVEEWAVGGGVRERTSPS